MISSGLTARLAPASVVGRRFHRHRNQRSSSILISFFCPDRQSPPGPRSDAPVVAVTDIEVADDLQQALVLGQLVLAVEVSDGQRRGDDFLHIVDAAPARLVRIRGWLRQRFAPWRNHPPAPSHGRLRWLPRIATPLPRSTSASITCLPSSTTWPGAAGSRFARCR